MSNSWPQAEGDIQGFIMGMPTMPGYFLIRELAQWKIQSGCNAAKSAGKWATFIAY
jgi:hypothetical protein